MATLAIKRETAPISYHFTFLNMWVPFEGPVLYKFEPKTASQVLSEGAVVDIVSGQITVANAAGQSHAGICQRTVLASDADYAANTATPMMVPLDPNCTWLVDVLDTDTISPADVDTFFDLAGSPVGILLTNTGVAHDAALIKDVNVTAQQVVAYLNSFKPMQNGV